MAAQPFVIPYRTIVTGDRPRPYLVMHVTGINGQNGPIVGIVDSGADTTTLPFGYVSLMGYTSATLTQETITQAAGTAMAYRALQPSTAVVPEIPEVPVEICPTFVQGQVALWGRLDFMACFEVVIMEKQQQFSITPCEEQ